MKRLLFVLLVVVCMAGCAATTINGVRENHSGIISFVSNQSFEDAYRKACDFSKGFETSYVGGPHLVVRCNLYSDIKKGEISIGLFDIIDDNKTIYMVVDVETKEQDKSFASIYYSFSPWKRHALKIKEAILQGVVTATTPE